MVLKGGPQARGASSPIRLLVFITILAVFDATDFRLWSQAAAAEPTRAELERKRAAVERAAHGTELTTEHAGGTV